MYKKILIAVAPGHTDVVPEMLEVARALAADGAEMTAFAVAETIPNYVAVELPEGIVDKSRVEIQNELEASIKDAPGVTGEVVIGHAAGTILEKAKEGYDLIVLRSHRPGLQDWFIGSTAAKVVHHANCAVHVVR